MLIVIRSFFYALAWYSSGDYELQLLDYAIVQILEIQMRRCYNFVFWQGFYLSFVSIMSSGLLL